MEMPIQSTKLIPSSLLQYSFAVQTIRLTINFNYTSIYLHKMMQKYKTKILDTSLHSIDTVLYNIFSWASCLPLAGRCSGCVVWMWPTLGSYIVPHVSSAAHSHASSSPPRGARSWSLETDILPQSVKTCLV